MSSNSSHITPQIQLLAYLARRNDKTRPADWSSRTEIDDVATAYQSGHRQHPVDTDVAQSHEHKSYRNVSNGTNFKVTRRQEAQQPSCMITYASTAPDSW